MIYLHRFLVIFTLSFNLKALKGDYKKSTQNHVKTIVWLPLLLRPGGIFENGHRWEELDVRWSYRFMNHPKPVFLRWSAIPKSLTWFLWMSKQIPTKAQASANHQFALSQSFKYAHLRQKVEHWLLTKVCEGSSEKELLQVLILLAKVCRHICRHIRACLNPSWTHLSRWVQYSLSPSRMLTASLVGLSETHGGHLALCPLHLLSLSQRKRWAEGSCIAKGCRPHCLAHSVGWHH